MSLSEAFLKNFQDAMDSRPPLHILYVGTHIQQTTGYAKVSHGILTELAAIPWLKITYFAFQKNRQIPLTRKLPANIEEIDVSARDTTVPQNGFGFHLLPEIINERRPDIVFIYNDLSIISQFIGSIQNTAHKPKVWLYVDQVYTMQHAAYIQLINKNADHVFTFTEGWKACLQSQGVTKPVGVITHGFSEALCPTIGRAVARKAIGLPEDLFIITSLNRNQPRKRLDILLMAFVELIVQHPDKPITLLCVCDKGDKGGWWLFEIYARELRLRGVDPMKFGDRLIVTSKDMIYTDEEINIFYNAGDIGVSCAEGEGFGLCTFEQMGLGIPQVVPALGGYKEYCTADNSLLVQPTLRYYLPTAQCPVGGEAYLCDSHAVFTAMETYLLSHELRASHGEAARNTVAKYTWASCVKELITALEKSQL